ncbi:DUF2249 domain-containing protein [Photobacterium sp. SDRW27]|uniref:DUF2249 domain-containing protein n=1 Tax=Photobacterium obscurum TaxID=2829490 RepID=UPI0022430ED4|nr:DUF2249 domain-containing protein [Photobacterium obscurum]MCW8327462.1 DUF2249 domain-containing protein [Photobacterium obscurum]
MDSIIILDVSDLEPPQPMHKICQTLSTLQSGQLLHVKHRREPVPLFAILTQQQFDYRHSKESEGKHHIWIWHQGDQVALKQLNEASK